MKTLTRLAAATIASTLLAGAAAAQTDLSLWYHGAGNEVERSILAGIVDDFNASQQDWKVSIEQFPQAAYNDSVTAAALSGELPDILDVDGPIMPNWAWAGYLAPLTIDPAKLDGFLPGVIGKWDGKVYSVGFWDAALAMFARKSVLEENGIRIPTLDKPWTKDELQEALQKLKDSGKFEYPLNIGMADKSEWYPYAYLPFLWSFGGGPRRSRRLPDGRGRAERRRRDRLGRMVPGPGQGRHGARHVAEPRRPPERLCRGQVCAELDRQLAGARRASRSSATTCCSCRRRTSGTGRKIGAASWQFAVSAKSEHQDGANAFIEFALQDKYFTAFSDGIGLIPPTRSAAAASKYYAPGQPMEVFYDLSEKQGMLRPVTPGYVVQSKVFQKVAADIADGADVPTVLDTAVDEIDADIKNNQGYGHQ